jgi:hypothetical protein
MKAVAESRLDQLARELNGMRKLAVEARPNFEVFFTREDVMILDNFRHYADSLLFKLQHRNGRLND